MKWLVIGSFTLLLLGPNMLGRDEPYPPSYPYHNRNAEAQIMLSVLDDLQWIARTVFQEAADQPYEGKLAVAFVIMNRAAQEKKSVPAVVLRKHQFSCWDSDSPTRPRLDESKSPDAWRDSYKAACAAYFGLVDDPSNGATHYFAPKLVAPPKWWSDAQQTAVIGDHRFARL